MVAVPQQPQKMTIEEYLEWELQQDVRYEYFNGEVFAMTRKKKVQAPKFMMLLAN